VTGPAPVRVLLYSLTSGDPVPVAVYSWTAQDGIGLRVLDPAWAQFAEQVLHRGAPSRAQQRSVPASEGPAFLQALLEPSRSTYVRFAAEGADPAGPAAPAVPDPAAPVAPAAGGGYSEQDAYRVLAGQPPLAAPGTAAAPVPRDPPGAGTVPLARTRDEALVYLDLNPCEQCGRADLAWDSALVSAAGEPARGYFGDCPGCGTRREFVFRLPARPSLAPPGTGPGGPWFGGPEPSELIDAGQWLWVADRVAGRVPVGDPAAARRALGLAAAALDEVLKFLPAGADRAPAGAFWSPAGRRVRAQSPGRFDRDRLQVIRDSYRARLEELPAA